MDFDELKDQWTGLGEEDPLWAVLSQDDVRHGTWDLESFFATGKKSVDQITRIVSAFVPDAGHGRALDFGCGVGRLSQALCDHYERVIGVDISAPMIESARRLNQHGERCEYRVSHEQDLSYLADGSIDFVLTLIVLQHMAIEYSTNYIREFVRVLSPDGVAVFQVPSRHRPPIERFRLPADAYRAVITPVQPTVELRCGELEFVPVRVRNVGSATWPSRPEGYDGDIRFRLGKRVYDGSGAVLAEDDERAPLAQDVAPGEEIVLSLPVRGPQEPGRYRAVLDLVHEHITWFADQGSPSSEMILNVSHPVSAAAADEVEPEAGPVVAAPAPIQMHCVPEETVRATVEASGGRVVATWASPDSGSDWDSFVYLVQRQD